MLSKKDKSSDIQEPWDEDKLNRKLIADCLNLAFLIFGEEIIVHLIQNAEIAEAQRTQFHMVWERARNAA